MASSWRTSGSVVPELGGYVVALPGHDDEAEGHQSAAASIVR